MLRVFFGVRGGIIKMKWIKVPGNLHQLYYFDSNNIFTIFGQVGEINVEFLKGIKNYKDSSVLSTFPYYYYNYVKGEIRPAYFLSEAKRKLKYDCKHYLQENEIYNIPPRRYKK